MNTHSFDGKWQDHFTPERSISSEEEWSVVEKMKQWSLSAGGHFVLRILLDDYQKAGNFDPIAKSSCDYLLYLIAKKLGENPSGEMLGLFDEILREMQTGLCPQGRSTRLYQFLLALE